MENSYNKIMNEYVPSDFIESTIKKLADTPERLIGVLHANTFELGSITSFGYSRNNSFGNAIEGVFKEIVRSNGWTAEPTKYVLSEYHLNTPLPPGKKSLAVDQVFSHGNTIVFIEQKIRDDHDTSKWRGQWDNFSLKLSALTEIYSEKRVVGVMWMIDDNFRRNEINYQRMIDGLDNDLRSNAILCYGESIDNVFNNIDGQKQAYFRKFFDFLVQWHNENVKVPEMNFDKFPYDSIRAFEKLNERQALNFFGNPDITEQVFPIIFPNRQTLKIYLMILKKIEKPSQKEKRITPLVQKLVEKY